MKILAVDTATKSCSVAMVEKASLLAEVTMIREQTHSKHLMEMIRTVVDLSGLSLGKVDGYAVSRGPGTFTGVRIGVSSLKGLAAASGKPVVGISSLDALAMQASLSPYLVCPLLDARRGEVYCSRYRFQNGKMMKETKENVLPPEIAIHDIKEPCLFVGNGARLYRAEIMDIMGDLAVFAPVFQNTIRASTIAYLSSDRFENGDTDDVGTLSPQYIRKSDAEINLANTGDSNR
ncbi:MAG: tRNA (adenosine(37)-N6)-threonylcarbamoyltransferase complex dimerization subunit type 1 TsaB [Deltaproteobacteria bacterium]|nr:tRNA (adenosine(37)-N6)-threonylcarbamoyltransferase complex dimerization subunit type 1 TsaB [Deltaproteobacteria bacterium]